MQPDVDFVGPGSFSLTYIIAGLFIAFIGPTIGAFIAHIFLAPIGFGALKSIGKICYVAGFIPVALLGVFLATTGFTWWGIGILLGLAIRIAWRVRSNRKDQGGEVVLRR